MPDKTPMEVQSLLLPVHALDLFPDLNQALAGHKTSL